MVIITVVNPIRTQSAVLVPRLKNSVSCCSNAAVCFKLASALFKAVVAAVSTVSGKSASGFARKSFSWKEHKQNSSYGISMINKPFALALLY